MIVFNDRADAGRQLANSLKDSYQDQKNTMILALPRGGVPVAYEIAKALHLPMTAFLVRKLGLPGHEEVAMGAIAESEVCILNQDLIAQLNITDENIQLILDKERREIGRRLQHYRQGQPLPDLRDQTIILVDDGIATGTTCKAAIEALNFLNPKKLILATPLASFESLQELCLLVDETVCLTIPSPFYAVAQWYLHFDQTTDEEVLDLLRSI